MAIALLCRRIADIWRIKNMKIHLRSLNCCGKNWRTKNKKMHDNGKQILVGKIVAPQGVRGEVRVQTYTATPVDMKDLRVHGTHVSDGAFHFVRAVPSSSVIIARIDGVNDRNAAEMLRGVELFINRDDLPAPGAGEYYQADLIGMRVLRDGVEIGRIAGFQNFGAGDIIELDNGDFVSFVGANVDFDNKIVKL